ncbi:MAG TPA: hypothetical protein VHP11_14620 [Tepidisphaeraceae bacterium]|nr:hypothetical protein [Tepidisphaeraceae bacterium]
MTGWFNTHPVHLIEPLVGRGDLKPIERSANCLIGDALFANPACIASQRFLDRALKVVKDRPKPRGSRQPQIVGPSIHRRVGVVNHSRLLSSQASMQEDRLAMASLEHVKVQANVRVGQTLAVEGALPRPLDATEHNQLHIAPVSFEGSAGLRIRILSTMP